MFSVAEMGSVGWLGLVLSARLFDARQTAECQTGQEKVWFIF